MVHPIPRTIARKPTLKRIFLDVAGDGTWNVPSSVSQIELVECYGPGAFGGGAYASKAIVSVTPGGTVDYHNGVAGSGQSTWFKTTGTVKAAGSVGGTGGQASASIGDVKHSGGNSGSGDAPGGGGAAGPNGPGLNGGNAGSNGSNQGGGANGGAGDGGSAPGGAGAPYVNFASSPPGQPGQLSNVYGDDVHGPYGGGGGAKTDFYGGARSAGAGGLFGGGGGIDGSGDNDPALNGAPGRGFIVLTYFE